MFNLWLSKIKMMRAYVSGDLSTAIEYAQKCLIENNQNIRALWILAECFRLQGKYEEAILYGRRGFSVDPRDMEILQLLTELYFDCKDYQQAYEYAYKAVLLEKKLDPQLLELQPYAEKMEKKLSSLAPTIIHGLNEGRKKKEDWINWAIEFIAWFESTRNSD